MKQQIAIKGMSCGGCVKSVEKALQTINGVQSVTVSLNPPQADLQTDHLISNELLKDVLGKAGHYSISEDPDGDNAPKKSGGSCCH